MANCLLTWNPSNYPTLQSQKVQTFIERRWWLNIAYFHRPAQHDATGRGHVQGEPLFTVRLLNKGRPQCRPFWFTPPPIFVYLFRNSLLFAYVWFICAMLAFVRRADCILAVQHCCYGNNVCVRWQRNAYCDVVLSYYNVFMTWCGKSVADPGDGTKEYCSCPKTNRSRKRWPPKEDP